MTRIVNFKNTPKRKKPKTRAIPLNCLSIEQTAWITGYAHSTLKQRMAPSGVKRYGKFKIPAKKHNGIWTFKRTDVIAYMLQEFGVEIDIDSALSKPAATTKTAQIP